jgi:hypothetical protein
MARLLIGTGTTWSSTAAGGITFELAPEEGLSPVLTHEEFRWPIFLLHLTAASEAALKTLVDSVNAALDDASGKDVAYESTNGTALFAMLASDWPVVQVEREIDFRGNEASVAFQIIGRLTSDTGGPPPPAPGAVDEIVWQYNLAGNQLAGMTAEGLFEATDSPAATALQNAQAWAAGIRGGSGRPAFAPSQLRVQEHLYQPIESASGFARVRAVLLLQEHPSAVATWPSMVADCGLQVTTVERSVVADVQAGISGGNAAISSREPSQQFVLTGQFTLLTEGNTTFDSALAKISPAGVRAKGLEAMNAVLSWFESVYSGSAANLRRSRDPVFDMRLDEGVVSFVQVYESATILEWAETITKAYQFPYGFSRDFEGKDWTYKPKGGAIAMIQREFRITMLGQTPNPGSFSGGNDWVLIAAERDAAVKVRSTNSEGRALLEITVRGSQTYRYANKGSTGMGEGQTSAGVIERTNIGGKDPL